MVADAETTLKEGAAQYLETLAGPALVSAQVEVQRFVRWCGADRTFGQLRGQEVANYAETLTGGVTDAAARADAVRRFLAFSKKEGYSSTNLGRHLRLKKTGSRDAAPRVASKEVQISAAQKDALEANLESLKEQRPRLVEDIRRAREDKDFRENAPLDAARQEQGYIEGRIRDIEATLANAAVVEDERASNASGAGIGSTVILRNLASGAETTYTLVRPSDVEAARGRISVESPVGKALLGAQRGDEVEASVPSGTVRFRLESVEG